MNTSTYAPERQESSFKLQTLPSMSCKFSNEFARIIQSNRNEAILWDSAGCSEQRIAQKYQEQLALPTSMPKLGRMNIFRMTISGD